MDSFEVLDRGRAAQIEEIFADAAISCSWPFSGSDMREAVFDGSAVPKALAANAGGLKFTQLVLKPLVVGDLHRASFSGRGVRAPASQGTAAADLGIELDDIARFEVLDLTCRTGDRFSAHVDLEIGFAEQLRLHVSKLPWLADDLGAMLSDRGNVGAVDVASIDEQLADANA